MKNSYNPISHSAETSDPSSANYGKTTNNKGHKKSPYCMEEPSTKTDFK